VVIGRDYESQPHIQETKKQDLLKRLRSTTQFLASILHIHYRKENEIHDHHTSHEMQNDLTELMKNKAEEIIINQNE
jgi:uncharacterized protein (DUF849 family)